MDPKSPEISNESDSSLVVSGSDLGYSPLQSIPFPGQTQFLCCFDQTLWSRSGPTIHICIRILGLMVASFIADPSLRFHSRLLQPNILTAWHKQAQSLNCPLCFISKTRLALACGFSSLEMELGKSFYPGIWKVLTANASLSGPWFRGLGLQRKLSSRSIRWNSRPLHSLFDTGSVNCKVTQPWLSWTMPWQWLTSTTTSSWTSQREGDLILASHACPERHTHSSHGKLADEPPWSSTSGFWRMVSSS